MPSPTIGLIVVAAGRSERMGGVDKVWEPIGPYPAVLHALHRLAGPVTHSVLVIRPELRRRAISQIGAHFPRTEIVLGGKARQDSVRKGLDSLPDVDVVAIHDAARPFPPPTLLPDGLTLLEQHDVALPVLPVVDTVKQINDSGEVLHTIDRTHLRAAQTPQLFKRESLVEAHNSDTLGATDDAILVEQLGGSIITYAGSPQNFKITTAFDLALAQLLVRHGALL